MLMCIRWVVCVHCCNVFSEFCICTVDVVLSLYRCFFPSNIATFREICTDRLMQCCFFVCLFLFVCLFCGTRVGYVIEEGNTWNVGTRQVCVMSSELSRAQWVSDILWQRGFFDCFFSYRGLMISTSMVFDDSYPDCSLALPGKRLNKVLGVFIFLFSRGVHPRSPLKKKKDVFVSTGRSLTIVPYFVCSFCLFLKHYFFSF